MSTGILGHQPKATKAPTPVVTYQMIKEVKWFSIGMALLTYGIEGTDANDEVCVRISDISTDKAFVSRFVGKCNHGKVAAVHVREILDDWLSFL